MSPIKNPGMCSVVGMGKSSVTSKGQCSVTEGGRPVVTAVGVPGFASKGVQIEPRWPCSRSFDFSQACPICNNQCSLKNGEVGEVEDGPIISGKTPPHLQADCSNKIIVKTTPPCDVNSITGIIIKA